MQPAALDMLQSHRLQNVRAVDSQGQYRAITSFYRQGKLDHLRIDKIYSFMDSFI